MYYESKDAGVVNGSDSRSDGAILVGSNPTSCNFYSIHLNFIISFNYKNYPSLYSLLPFLVQP